MLVYLNTLSYADPNIFVRRGPTLTKFVYFFSLILLVYLYEGWEDHNITQSGPSSACQRNAIEMAIRWRADDSPTSNAGLK